MANRKRIQTRGRKYVQETEAEGSSVGVSAAPTAQLALNNKAHELQMCKKKMEWQNEKIEELTKERDFLKEQLVSALKKDGHKATAGSSSVSTLDSSSSEMSSKSTDSESSNSSSSEDKKRKKKGKGRKKASKMVKMEKTLQRARNPEQALARYKKILKCYKRLGTMSGAFRKVGVDRNTVVVNAPIAELSIAAPDQYKEALKTYTHSTKLKAFAEHCALTILGDVEIVDAVNTLKASGKLLPLKKK
ncbi:unnamed protein product [Arctogadus glacialis]